MSAGRPKLKYLMPGDPVPAYTNHVYIERALDLSISVGGSSNASGRVNYYYAAPTRNLNQAISIALQWAAENDVPTVYVRDKAL